MTTAETDPGEDRFLSAGDVIEYSLDVTNTGNTCLKDVSISDEGMSIDCDVRYTGETASSYGCWQTFVDKDVKVYLPSRIAARSTDP